VSVGVGVLLALSTIHPPSCKLGVCCPPPLVWCHARQQASTNQPKRITSGCSIYNTNNIIQHWSLHHERSTVHTPTSHRHLGPPPHTHTRTHLHASWLSAIPPSMPLLPPALLATSLPPRQQPVQQHTHFFSITPRPTFLQAGCLLSHSKAPALLAASLPPADQPTQEFPLLHTKHQHPNTARILTQAWMPSQPPPHPRTHCFVVALKFTTLAHLHASWLSAAPPSRSLPPPALLAAALPPSGGSGAMPTTSQTAAELTHGTCSDCRRCCCWCSMLLAVVVV
jgi:hypothetical protein